MRSQAEIKKRIQQLEDYIRELENNPYKHDKDTFQQYMDWSRAELAGLKWTIGV